MIKVMIDDNGRRSGLGEFDADGMLTRRRVESDLDFVVGREQQGVSDRRV